MKQLEISYIPMYIEYNGKKENLSMNKDRQRHWGTKNDLKEIFYNMVELPTSIVKFENTVELEYTMHLNSNKRIDLMNFGAIIDKYTQDFLVTHEIITDDSHKIVKKVSFIVADIDRSIKPHFSLIIKDYNGFQKL